MRSKTPNRVTPPPTYVISNYVFLFWRRLPPDTIYEANCTYYSVSFWRFLRFAELPWARTDARPPFLNSEAEHRFIEAGEPDTEPQERTIMVSKVTERPGLDEAGIKVFEVSNEQQKAKNRRGISRFFACCEEILKEKGRSFVHLKKILDFFKSCSRTRASQPVWLGIADDSTDQPSTVHMKVLRP